MGDLWGVPHPHADFLYVVGRCDITWLEHSKVFKGNKRIVHPSQKYIVMTGRSNSMESSIESIKFSFATYKGLRRMITSTCVSFINLGKVPVPFQKGQYDLFLYFVEYFSLDKILMDIYMKGKG